MEEVIAVETAGLLGSWGTDWENAATKARSSLNTAFNYLIVSGKIQHGAVFGSKSLEMLGDFFF